jgi:hypothetical protein
MDVSIEKVLQVIANIIAIVVGALALIDRLKTK